MIFPFFFALPLADAFFWVAKSAAALLVGGKIAFCGKCGKLPGKDGWPLLGMLGWVVYDFFTTVFS